MGKNILITGGAGFIAHHLVKELGQDERNDLIVVLDHNTSKLKKGFWDDSTCPIKVVNGDITELPAISPHIEQADICYHLASKTSVPESMENPYSHFFNNVFGSLNVISECLEHKTRLVFTSSFAIYGMGATLPITEFSPPNPLSPYALSKSTVENYIELYTKLFNLNATTLRLTNVYGLLKEGNAVSTFISKLLDGEPITVFGNGEQSRDFVAVEDVVNALMKAGNGKVKGTFNIGSGKETSVNELLKLLREKIVSDSPVKYEKARKGEVKHSVADITKARKELEWRPETSLTKGIEKILKEMEGN